MRVIDRLVGVPLCLLVCGLYRVIEFVFRPDVKQPGKILLVEMSEMGSAILADPAMRWIQQQGGELFFVIFTHNACSLNLLNTVPSGNIFKIRPDNCWTLLVDSIRCLFWCREKNIDTTIDLEMFSRYTSLLTRMSGAVNRAGYHSVHAEGLYRGNHLTHPLMYNPYLHISQNFISLAKAVFGSPGQPYQKIKIHKEDIVLEKARVTPLETEVIVSKIRSLKPSFDPDCHRIMLVNPNASDLLPQRRWMTDRFEAVISAVLHHYQDVVVLITGAPSEFSEADILQKKVNHNRCLNSAGHFLFDELVPLYSISELLLSNDSGPPHFASVTDLPTFVMFGPETPDLYVALGNCTPIYAGLACSPCVSAWNHRKTSCRDNQCLKAISVEQVLQAIKPVLDNQLITKSI